MINWTLTQNSVTGSTGSSNDGQGIGGGMYPDITATFNIGNTIVAGNTASTSSPDASGTFTSQGHNLVGNGDNSTGFTGTGDQVGTTGSEIDPKLGPLAYNGGPTQTHALLTSSPALDAGNNAFSDTAGLTTDQRAVARKLDSASDADTTQTVDIGSFEADPSVCLLSSTRMPFVDISRPVNSGVRHL